VAIVNKLNDWDLLPQPERLTELYFTDYNQLPKSLVAGSTEKVTFTVRNLEHQTTTYHYKLIATSEAQAEQTLSNGTFILKHDESQTAQEDIIVPASLGSRISIKVDLYYQGKTEDMQTQSIQYWTDITPTKLGDKDKP
jgi:hypothetical protein